jgi:hypothetical protein
MTLGALRVSAIALSAAAFVLSSPLSAADAATVPHHSGYAAHPRVSHGFHGRVARAHSGHRHYVWRNGHRYVYGYGYNPGAGVAAGYPYCGDYYYGPYYGSCDDYSYGYPYPYYDYGYGFGGPVFVGRGRFHHRFDQGFDHASTMASLSTATGLISPAEISATWASAAASSVAVISPASAAATWAASAAATWAASAAAGTSRANAPFALWFGFGRPPGRPISFGETTSDRNHLG